MAHRHTPWVLGAWSIVLLLAGTARGELRIGDICRVKGQEANTLFGIGLVVGLRGTGDGKSPTALRRLARILEQSGNPIARTTAGDYLHKELENTKNVALVTVTVTVPPQGARQGDELSCTVTAIAAKSLEGGVLLPTALQARQGETRVYGFASGLLTIEDPKLPTVGRIPKGARLEETFAHPFEKDGKITLVLRPPFATFQTAYEVEETISRHVENYFTTDDTSGTPAAAAVDATTIEVRIPQAYKHNVVQFIAQIMELRLVLMTQQARVVVDDRTGTIVATGNVRIGPVVVAHRNLTIDARQGPAAKFVPIDSRNGTSTTSIEGLLQALDALQVPTSDVIAILRKIRKSGALYAEFVEGE